MPKMEIRRAEDQDVPVIVNLLKESLGEDLMPKSIKYWQWKHIDNPFGKSPVLLAFEGQKLVGVRAFMCWQWNDNGLTIRAVRAVDTATHPEYQGKGIFSKLTRELLAQCAAENMDMVFNTPNTKSMPGYLKMGWLRAGRLPISLKIVRPVSMALSLLRKTNRDIQADNSVQQVLGNPGMSALLLASAKNRGGIGTLHTLESLRWRYQTVPVATYHAASLETGNSIGGAIFYRLKNTRIGMEMRITDIFTIDQKIQVPLVNIIRLEAKKVGADYITWSGFHEEKIPGGIFSVKRISKGPEVTVRPIGNFAVQQWIDFKNWVPSLGDLELF